MPGGTRFDGEYADHNGQCLTTIAPVSISDTAASNGTAFSVGKWTARATADCYVVQGTSTTDADTDDYFLPAGVEIQFFVSATGVDDYLSAICDTGVTGSIYYRKL